MKWVQLVVPLRLGLTQLAAFRPPVRTGIPALDSPEVDGLHFVGASTRPGNGVPLVLMGVKVRMSVCLFGHCGSPTRIIYKRLFLMPFFSSSSRSYIEVVFEAIIKKHGAGVKSQSK